MVPFFAYPIDVGLIIYTTNAIESLNSLMRKAERILGHFPSDKAAAKLLLLVLREVSKYWKMAKLEWNTAKAQFAVMFAHHFFAS